LFQNDYDIVLTACSQASEWQMAN